MLTIGKTNTEILSNIRKKWKNKLLINAQGMINHYIKQEMKKTCLTHLELLATWLFRPHLQIVLII